MGSCHSLRLRHANSAGLDNNFSDYSSEEDFLEQCLAYCFQAPSTSSLPLIWACAQKSALYVLSPALAVTWPVNKQKWSEMSWKCCSCSLHPDMASLITLAFFRRSFVCLLFHPEAWVSVWAALHLTNPSVSEPVFACTSTFLFDTLCLNDCSAWLIQLIFQFTGSDLSSCSWEMCKVYGILANQMYLCRPIIQ